MSTRTKIVQVRLTKAERKAWQAEAKKNGVTLSEWIRLKCTGYVGDAFGRLFAREIEAFGKHMDAKEKELDEHGYGGKP
jgi:hypothetical protein